MPVHAVCACACVERGRELKLPEVFGKSLKEYRLTRRELIRFISCFTLEIWDYKLRVWYIGVKINFEPRFISQCGKTMQEFSNYRLRF